MRIVTIKEVLGLGSGEVVPAVKGTIKNVYDQNKGTNSHGDWKLQNLMLTDSTGEIKVKVADRDPIPANWKGRVVCIECNDGGKGLTGIKAKDDEYRGKVSRILSVTPTAHMTLVEPGQAAQPAQQPAQPAQQQPQAPQQAQAAQTQPAPQAAQPPATNGNGNGAGKRVTEAATTRARDYYRVMDAVQVMRTSWDANHPHALMTDAHFQAACSTVFIQLQRDGVINGNH